MNNSESAGSNRRKIWIKATVALVFSAALIFVIGLGMIFADLIEFSFRPTVKDVPVIKHKENSSYWILDSRNQYLFDRLYGKMIGIFENGEKITDFYISYDEEWYEIKKKETGFNDLKFSYSIFGDLIEVAKNWYYFNDFEVNAVRSLNEDFPYLFAWNSRSESIYVTPHFFVRDFGIEIRMPVDDAYGDELCHISDEGSKLIVSAYHNAKRIAGLFEESDDHTRLMRYLESVLLFADYDYEAYEMIVNHPEDTDYSKEENSKILVTSNIINVFDGDPSTLSVCSGYSKSFQLLCDLSEFDEDIECYCVGGMFYGFDEQSGYGAHMWNVVKMDDGNRYLVDVTHSEPYQMGVNRENITFLKGVEKMQDTGDFSLAYYVDNKEYRCTYDTDEESFLSDGNWFNELSQSDYR